MVAELCGHAGFDWLLIDGEHAPFDVPRIAAQLQSLSSSESATVVRVPVGEPWIIKQVLDIGAQSLLVPMVETAEQAERLVAATRYPPRGVRGVGAALARASGFNSISDYLVTADDQICLLVQVESIAAIDAVEAIANVPGVDGVFVGPSDLAADMGYLGRPFEAQVQDVVERAIRQICNSAKPAGILTSDLRLAERYLTMGASFVAVGSDVGLLTQSAKKLISAFRPPPS